MYEQMYWNWNACTFYGDIFSEMWSGSNTGDQDIGAQKVSNMNNPNTGWINSEKNSAYPCLGFSVKNWSCDNIVT